jgi:CubicO group peptidase (beta-lactamase class C family)
MSDDTANVTLRQLMTMSGGFDATCPWGISGRSRRSLAETTPTGIQLGPAGLRLTAPDMIKIGELYRRDGVWNGHQMVPADWIQQSTSP